MKELCNRGGGEEGPLILLCGWHCTYLVYIFHKSLYLYYTSSTSHIILMTFSFFLLLFCMTSSTWCILVAIHFLIPWERKNGKRREAWLVGDASAFLYYLSIYYIHPLCLPPTHLLCIFYHLEQKIITLYCCLFLYLEWLFYQEHIEIWAILIMMWEHGLEAREGIWGIFF